MILGYDFVEERLFAAVNYANLTKPRADSLRKFRSELASDLNKARNKYRGNQNMLDLHKNSAKSLAGQAEHGLRWDQYSKQGTGLRGY